jgi:hypothetical protein
MFGTVRRWLAPMIWSLNSNYIQNNIKKEVTKTLNFGD